MDTMETLPFESLSPVISGNGPEIRGSGGGKKNDEGEPSVPPDVPPPSIAEVSESMEPTEPSDVETKENIEVESVVVEIPDEEVVKNDIKKDLSQDFDTAVENKQEQEEVPSLRDEAPKEWEKIPPISREDQGVKPRGRRPKRKATEENTGAGEVSGKKPRASRKKSTKEEKKVEKKVEETKGKPTEKENDKTHLVEKKKKKTAGVKVKAVPEETGKVKGTGSKPKQSNQETPNNKRKRAASEPSAPAALNKDSPSPGARARASLPLGTVPLFHMLDKKDYQKHIASMVKSKNLDWHLCFAVSSRNINTIWRFINEKCEFDGTPLDSDFPITVCRGKLPKGKAKEHDRKVDEAGETGEAGKQDKKAEQKARISRKSAAYHRTRKAKLAEGATEEEAKTAAKEAGLQDLSKLTYVRE